MYQLHPSQTLRDAFRHKPYQGAHPALAEFLFVGLDANYSPDIETKPIFRNLLSYHEDGPAFWRTNGIHYPFLLPGYGKDGGRLYHKRFASIGFGPPHAEAVSFVELLHLPTVGRSRLTADDLDEQHLAFVDQAIRRGHARHVFIPPDALRLMKKLSVFDWLDVPIKMTEPLHVIDSTGDREIHRLYHLSNYGSHQKRIDADLAAMAGLLARASKDQ